MAKKPSPPQEVHVLLDGHSGWLGVFSSRDAAVEASESLGSHTGRKLDVLTVPYWYDRMGLNDMSIVLKAIKPPERP